MLVRLSLRWRVKKFTTVTAFQTEVAKYLHQLIKKSTNGFTFNGLEKLDMSKPTLFISNHRDIALDPALLNLALYKSGINTVEIAIGDNLLSKPWVSDLMRLNKSFIVKRSEKNKRAMLTASKSLSSYIHHTLTHNHHNVWIAQREGRAKDGIDKTNAALISMLLLNKDKQQSISEYLTQLNIVPISISYQFDPCDSDKAKELATIEATGAYQKAEGEDLKSITQGILGHKGQVHIEFGSPILGDYENSKAIASEIDRQIISNYKLYNSNLAADALLKDPRSAIELPNELTQRMQQLDKIQQRWLLEMYANPVIAKVALTD
jgi:1-acyl-sn-glycerol-3-phosphate acyltransferase